MNHNELLELKSRRFIYKCIQKHPYLHVRELERITKIPFTTIRYHLRYLQKNELINVKKEGGFNRYYVTQSISLQEKKLLEILRQKIPRKIVAHIFLVKVATPKELSFFFKRHISTIQYHLDKLIEMKIVEEAPVKNNLIKINSEDSFYVEHIKNKNERLYRFTDYDLLKNFFIKYSKSFIDDDYDDYLEVCFELSKELDSQTKRFKKWKLAFKNEDSIIDAVFDMFPHPYHI